MKDDRVKIRLPSEPFQIGTTADGKPIWTDPKDMIQSPDEKLEQRHNMNQNRFDGNVEKIVDVVLRNAQAFVAETVIKTADSTGIRLFSESSEKPIEQWMNKAGYRAIQDGLTTVVKVKDRVIRTMTADVDVRFRAAVIKRIMQRIQSVSLAA